MSSIGLIAALVRGTGNKGKRRRAILIAAVIGITLARSAAAAPRVAVFESPTAMEWLRSAGIECRSLSELELSGLLSDTQLIVLPLDRIRSDTPLRALSAFTARGGKVIGVYWGTIARPDQQAGYPVYGAASVLGVRVLGWTLTGPAAVKLEVPAVTAYPVPDLSRDPGEPAASSGSRPPSAAPEIRLDQWMMVRVEAEPTAQILARLVPAAGPTSLVLAVRNGNMFYVAANLFHRGSGSLELRRLFFWVLDQAIPGLAYAQVRERAGAAVAAVIHARARLAATNPAADAIRRLLDEAGAAASRAKALAASDQFAESVAAADQARELTERALGMMEGH
jgi:hypothetical protein